MTGIGISFPSGRFHATPWGRHVNEGAPEWPPAPWRLLRSLVATWKGKLDGRFDPDPDKEREAVRGLLETLAAPPHFVLPPASTGHSRHYMPWFKKGPDDKTLVFDAFVALPKPARNGGAAPLNPAGCEVMILWPETDLTGEQRMMLVLLLEHLGFLGRAEAWCEARLLDATEYADARAKINCQPLTDIATGRDEEVVRVLCIDPDTAFGSEKFHRVDRKFSKTGKVTESRKRTAEPYDPDWHLCAETLWLHRERWSDPPGSRWVSYARRRDCFKVRPVVPPRPSAAPAFQVARFALDSAVLPLVTDTLRVAEDARRNLMFHFGAVTKAAAGEKGRSEVFAGKDSEGAPLEGHQHAYFLPTDEDADGRLDHLTIVAAMGFGTGELRAIDRLRELKSREREESGHPLHVLLLGLGRLGDYTPFPLRTCNAWISATPFVAPRFPKPRGTKRDAPELLASPVLFLEAVLREEVARLILRRPDLSRLDLDEIKTEPLLDHGTFRLPDREGNPRGPRPIQFWRYRQKRGDDGGNRRAGFFRITFLEPVAGPLCLGHSSHFGLGLFIPAE